MSASFEEKSDSDYNNLFKKEKNFGMFKFFINLQREKNAEKFVNEVIENINENNKLKLLFKIINDGYKLNVKQQLQVDEVICELAQIYKQYITTIKNERGESELTSIGKRELFEKYESYLKEGIQIPDYYLISPMFYTPDILNIYIRNDDHPQLKKLYEQKLKDPVFKRKMFDYWSASLNDIVEDKVLYKTEKRNKGLYLTPELYYEIRIVDGIMVWGKEIFSEISIEEYADTLNKFQKFPHVPKNIDSDYKAFARQNSIAGAAKSFGRKLDKKGFFVLNKNKVTNENEVEVQELKNKDDLILPIHLESLLKEITDKYNEIITDKKLLPNEDLFTIQNIFENRLPQTLNNYKEVHKKYINDVVNRDNKSAEDLLETSLKTIIEIIDNMIMQQDERKIKELSVTSSYIKSVRKMN